MLNVIISEVLRIHCDIINRNIVAKWNNMRGIHGEARADPALIEVIGTTVMATMNFSGQKAWIAEWGSGSLADTSDNPYIDEYVSSGNFNHHRSKGDMSIRGRDAGSYTDLDGNPQTSNGHNAGKDLELKPVYPVMYPTHLVRDEVLQELPDIIAHIQRATAEYIAAQLTMDVQIYL